MTDSEEAANPDEGVRRPWPADADWWRADEESAGPPDVGEEPAPQPGPFVQPPRVTKPAPEPRPTPTVNSAINAPAQLMPIVAPPIWPPPAPAAPPQVEAAVEAADPADAADRTERLVAVPVQRTPPAPPPRTRAVRRRKHPRRPWLGLPALVLLTLVAGFFSWVSAEPFWLAMGHGHTGSATIVSADGGCRASFVADAGAFRVSKVELAGASSCQAGTAMPARMISEQAARAYAADDFGLRLRWVVGFGLVLVCGLAILWVTGATRFHGWRRIVSVGLSLGGPATIAAVMLATSWR